MLRDTKSKKLSAFEVFKELNEAVEEVIQIFKEDGKPLPEPKEVVFEAA